MYKPVLSIDVSKSKSCAAAFLNHGEPYLKPFSFRHSPEDTNSLIRQLKNLEEKTGIKPEVVLEATGNFSKPILISLTNQVITLLCLILYRRISRKLNPSERLKLILLMLTGLLKYTT